MRRIRAGLSILITTALLSGVAVAGSGPAEKDKGGGGGGGGSSGGGSSGSSSTTSHDQSGADGGEDRQLPSDLKWGGLVDMRRAPKWYKPWEVGASWETHALVIQNDVEGNQKLVNYFYGYATADITEHNRIGIRLGAFQYAIADSTETGFRFDDVTTSYTRLIPLPRKILLKVSARLTWGTSFISQLQSLIVEPRLAISVDKTFDFGRGGSFSVDLRTWGAGEVVKYATFQGGATPNPKGLVGGLVEVEYAMGFHRALSIGAEFLTEYIWYYNVAGALPAQFAGTVADANYPSQPVQQLYGGEVFVNYALPRFKKIKVDIKVAFANGDPTMGYTSTLHDGVGHVYGFWRRSSQVYAALDVHY